MRKNSSLKGGSNCTFDEVVGAYAFQGVQETKVRKLQAAYRAHCVRRTLKLQRLALLNAGPHLEHFKECARCIIPLVRGTLGDFTHHLCDKHWLEWKDTKHRYGTYLSEYFGEFEQSKSSNSDFFEWLDGGHVDLAQKGGTSREELEDAQVEYCDDESRKKHAVLETLVGGRLQLTNAKILEDHGDGKLIFVIGPDWTMYVHPKIKGKFHHTSFLAGGPVVFAGTAWLDEDRCVSSVEPHSGHYKPGLQDLDRLICRWSSSDVGLNLSLIKWVKPNSWKGPWPIDEDGVYKLQSPDKNR